MPTHLSHSDRDFIAPYLSQTYSAQFPSRPFYLGHDVGLDIGVSVQYRDLYKVKEQFSTDDVNSGLALTHIYLNKSLVYGMEIGFSSLVTSLSPSVVSGFGGHLRWYPNVFSNKNLQLLLQTYTEFTKFEDAFFNQDLGFHLGLGYNRQDISFYTGLDFVFSQSSFVGVANSKPITLSGNREEVDTTSFSPFFSLLFHFENININLIQSYNFQASWLTRLNLSYSI